MGFFDAAIFRFVTVCFLAASGFSLFAQGMGASAVMENFALPEYRDGGKKLQFILYGKKAENLGAFINLTSPILDIVKSDIQSVTDVKPILNKPLYPFGASSNEVREFWKNYPHSQTFITAETAVYDKNTKILRSDAVTELRSREMDLQGVGFDADYERKIVHIRSKVKVIIRAETREKAEQRDTKPEQNQKGIKK